MTAFAKSRRRNEKRRAYQPRVFDGRVILSLDRQYREVGAVAVERLDAPPITRMVLGLRPMSDSAVVRFEFFLH
jgi:hypothetical protein